METQSIARLTYNLTTRDLLAQFLLFSTMHDLQQNKIAKHAKRKRKKSLSEEAKQISQTQL